jgi:hypothetical protein
MQLPKTLEKSLLRRAAKWADDHPVMAALLIARCYPWYVRAEIARERRSNLFECVGAAATIAADRFYERVREDGADEPHLHVVEFTPAASDHGPN